MSIGALAAFQPIIVPSGPEFGVPYVLTNADGQRAVFNDETDPDYVGVLTDVSGFDSPEVRENSDDLVEMDGGLHGDFYYGRRPVTLEGQIMHNGDTTLRNMQIAKLQRASSALRDDASLVWTPDGGVQQYVNLRRQQPLRVTGGFNKTFQLSMVASDPRIYSTALHGSQVSAGIPSGAEAGFGFDMTFPLNFGAAIPSGQMYLINQGNAESFPIYYVYGPGTSPAIINMTTGKVISMLLTLGLLDVLIIDTRERTVRLAQRSGADDVVNLMTTPGFTVAGDVGNWSNRVSSPVSTLAVATNATAPSGLGTAGLYTITSGAATVDAGIISGTLLGVTASTQYQVQFSISKAQAIARNAYARIAWYDSTNNFLAQEAGAQIAIPAVGSWATIVSSFTSPAGATRAVVELIVDAAGSGAFATGEAFSYDQMAMVKGATPIWASGDTPGWSWTSTAWSSQPRQPGIEINLDTANDRYGALDFANTQWSGIVPGSNDVRLSYFSFSTGAKLVADYRDAWM